MHRTSLCILADQDDAVFLLHQHFQSVFCIFRGDDYFEENLVDLFGYFFIDCAVGNQDTAECRNRVSGQCLFPCFKHSRTGCDTAGIIMFQDSECQFVELVDQANGSIDIQQVVVGDLFTMDLVEHIVELAIVFSSLVRIFTITQVHRLVYGSTEMRTLASIEIIENSRVIAG